MKRSPRHNNLANGYRDDLNEGEEPVHARKAKEEQEERQHKSASMVVTHTDLITEALAAPAMIVQIWCRSCMSPDDIDINVLWRGYSKNKFCNVRSMSCKIVTRCGDWLRHHNS